MRPEELRVGNFVNKLNDPDNYYISDWITISNAHLYKPIPLTEQWLERFGFTTGEFDNAIVLPVGKGSELHLEKSVPDQSEFNILLTRSAVVIGNQFVYAGTIEYVHQLQNLYYSLTGKELEIKD